MVSVDGFKSLQMSSDENFSYHCNPCDYEGIKKKATFFCPECQDYLCETCNIVHQKFSSTRKHKVVSGSLLSAKGEGTKGHENTGTKVQCYCNRMEVTHYCKDHDTLTCTECKTLKHRKCRGSTIEEACLGSNHLPLEAAKHDMQCLKERLNILQQRRKEDMKDLSLQTATCRKSLEQFKKDIICQVENMMKNSVDDIEGCDSSQRRSMEQHSHECDTALKKLSSDYGAFEKAVTSQETKDVFIHSLLFKQTLATLNRVLLDIEKEITPPCVSFQGNTSLMDLLTNSLGVVSSAPTVAGMRIKSKELLDVKFSCDEKEPWISASLFMSNGELVLCDRSNSSLKVLTALLTPKDQIQLPSSPRDFDLISNGEVIITLPENKSLLFVKVLPKLQLGSSITLDQECLGVAVKDESIFVSFRNGEIRIIDVAGKQQRNVYSLFCFQDPFYISFTRNGSLLVSEGSGNKIRVFDDGKEIQSYTHPGLTLPLGMYVDGGENIFVCGLASENIHIIDKCGKFKKFTLSKNDGLNEPYTMSFRPCDNIFIVGGRAQRKLIICKMF